MYMTQYKKTNLRIMSELYQGLQLCKDNSSLYVKLKWESDLNVGLSEGDHSMHVTQNTCVKYRKQKSVGDCVCM